MQELVDVTPCGIMVKASAASACDWHAEPTAVPFIDVNPMPIRRHCDGRETISGGRSTDAGLSPLEGSIKDIDKAFY